MASLKQLHADYGLTATVTVPSTGQSLALVFPKGVKGIPVKISAGPFNLEGWAVLEERRAPDGEADLIVTFAAPAEWRAEEAPAPKTEAVIAVAEAAQVPVVDVPLVTPPEPAPAPVTEAKEEAAPVIEPKSEAKPEPKPEPSYKGGKK